MKNYIFIVSLIVLISFAFVAFAKSKPNGQPFQALWEAIEEFGPQDPQGPPGESNWDEDRIAELEEQVELLRNRECFLGTTLTCDTDLLGACSVGTKSCNDSLVWGECIADNEPENEICDDEIDNDCDGEVDEECGS